MSQTNKEKYLEKMMKDTPFFHLPVFLDAVCKSEWDVAIVEGKEGNLLASMPYYIENRGGYNNIVHPHMAQFMGPWLNREYISTKTHHRTHQLLKELMTQLPSCDAYFQEWHFSQTNWLPFYWEGYEQSTRYTYTVDCSKGEETVWKNISSNVRRDIKNAAKVMEVVEDDSIDFDTFFDIVESTFKRKDIEMVYDKEIFRELDISLKADNRRKIYYAKHEDGTLCAAMYLVADESTIYYLAGGIKEEYKRYNPISILHWESLKYAVSVSKIFDFEGSMLPSVEQFIRRFGTEQNAYHSIQKIYSKKIKIKNHIKAFIQLLKF